MDIRRCPAVFVPHCYISAGVVPPPILIHLGGGMGVAHEVAFVRVPPQTLMDWINSYLPKEKYRKRCAEIKAKTPELKDDTYWGSEEEIEWIYGGVSFVRSSDKLCVF